MKFYLHYEEPPETTIVMKWPEDKKGCIRDVLQIFLDSACEELKTKLTIGNVVLLNSKREQIPVDANPLSVITNKEDIFVTYLGPRLKKTKEGHQLDKAMSSLAISLDKQDREGAQVKELLREAGEYKEGGLYRLAVTAYKEVLYVDEKNKETLHGLVSIYLLANRPSEAIKFAKRGEKYYPKDLDFKIEVATAMLQFRDRYDPVQYLLDICKERRKGGGLDGRDKWRLQCLLAKAYMQQEKRDMAIVVYQGVLRENPDYVDAMTGLAIIAYDLNDTYFKECVSVLLAALAKQTGDNEVKKNLVKICQMPGGMKGLQSSMQSAWDSTSAVFYIACVFRQWGGTDQAVELMDICCELEPQNPQIFLTLAHMLEGKCQYRESVQLLRTFLCEKSSSQTLGPVSLEEIIHLLDSVYKWKISATFEKMTPPQGLEREFEEKELYTIAILFTLVKILFIEGHLSVLPELVKLLAPLHDGKMLHTTDIRNEAAYFYCISKVICDCQPEIPKMDGKFIYHLGDSHCLTSAWRCIMYRGFEHTIHPVLSTGTKIWHLRPDSLFYSKENFNTAVKTIPNGATVIVNFGEIDCREGLMQCVDKCRYESLDDAIKCILDIYIDVLGQLHRDHKWKMFVHPVPPVLAMTRSVVDKFNNCLKFQLKDHPFLCYLDIVDSLLNEDRSAIKTEYEFDNTHLHPSYTTLLEFAVNSAFS
ncbi:uncharacterized protein LOC135494744 [Lineus longissimus]|uniref:uncharacterized protein LOC135494744 n=1 Tax=Lineus longissimus TaxID=88925 RepID=UPI00315CF3FC